MFNNYTNNVVELLSKENDFAKKRIQELSRQVKQLEAELHSAREELGELRELRQQVAKAREALGL